MQPRTIDNPWVRRTRFLTQALIISGALNIGLVSTFVYFVLKEKQDALAIELTPITKKEAPVTNTQLLRSYSLLPFQELILRLDTLDQLEEGLTKRDIALGCLVAFHHFNLDKALGSQPLQKRTLPFTNAEGHETIEIPVFPGLADAQFSAIASYAKTEKWPLTPQGLFYEVKRNPNPKDPTLIEAFTLTSEYNSAYILLSRTGLNLTQDQVIDLLCEGDWKILSDLNSQQRIAMDLTPDKRRTFLLEYLAHHSKLVAKLLTETDVEFVTKRMSDAQILTLLDLYIDKNSTLEALAKELLASPRTDAVYARAASILYSVLGEIPPEPYNHQIALQRFLPPQAAPEPKVPVIQVKNTLEAPKASKTKKKLHTIEPGDNLWKIARKYHVSVDEIMRTNRMETEKLRVGKQLEIPEGKKR